MKKRETVTPMSPDAVNELLENRGSEITSGNEAAEIELRRGIEQLRSVGGDDLLRKIAIQFALPLEADLRANHPEHPMLPILDDYHRTTR